MTEWKEVRNTAGLAGLAERFLGRFDDGQELVLKFVRDNEKPHLISKDGRRFEMGKDASPKLVSWQELPAQK
ncbi:MAG: hypothetical protein GXP06_13060 [Alphaproteobacteria bacterium]|nr:hypothetical protein [Alphaproteobacteria bacterium]